MSRIALVYTGIPDNFENNCKSHKFLTTPDTDIYISSWGHIDIQHVMMQLPYNNVTTITLSDSAKTETFIKNRIDEMFQHDSRVVNKDALVACMMNYYVMNQGYKSISFPKRYDMIVRLRFDVCFHDSHPSLAEMLYYSQSKYVHNGHRDRFNYGHPRAMDVVMSIFDKCDDWYVGSDRPNIELVFENYLKKNDIMHINNFKQFSIIKNENDIRNQLMVS